MASKPILLDENNILLKRSSLDNTEEFVESFNKYNCVTPQTQLIIVGTITPPQGVENGYFYTAPRNKIYGYIDEAIKTNLKELKGSLKSTTNEAEVLNQIKDILKTNNIAFLDIMKYAIRKKNSPYDEDIKYYNLDIESFRNLSDSVYFICNSKLAQEGYEKICEELGREINGIYLSQRRARKIDWVKEIESGLGK